MIMKQYLRTTKSLSIVDDQIHNYTYTTPNLVDGL